jgi:hypothetical protein
MVDMMIRLIVTVIKAARNVPKESLDETEEGVVTVFVVGKIEEEEEEEVVGIVTAVLETMPNRRQKGLTHTPQRKIQRNRLQKAPSLQHMDTQK